MELIYVHIVLSKISNFVKGKTLPSMLTFKRELVVGWLQEAKEDCTSPFYAEEEQYYGGTAFIYHDAGTYWTEPHQLYTWWKNNIERRSKYKVLVQDSRYVGADPRDIARARWCETIISLAQVIRASSGNINQLKSRPNELDEVDLIAPIPSTRQRKETFKAATASAAMRKDPFGNDVGYFMHFPAVDRKKAVAASSSSGNFPMKLYSIIEGMATHSIAINGPDATPMSSSSEITAVDPTAASPVTAAATKPASKCVGWVANGTAFQIYDEVNLFQLLKHHFNCKSRISLVTIFYPLILCC
jgi:hypothetical protein